MAVTSRLVINGIISSLASGKKKIGPLVRTDSSGASQTTQISLSSGFNSIAVPANASGVLIIFDSTSAVAKTLKGVTGDTGYPVDPAGFNFISFNPASVPSTIGITAASADTGLYTEIVFF